MHLHETILCSTAGLSSSAGHGAITLHDIHTGSPLASFKQTNAAKHCTAVVESRGGQGGLMLSSQPDKSILNVYNFQKDQIALKIVLPEKLTCISVDCRGDYCAGGTSQGRIYLWETASGILYNSWDAHYRRVTVLRFSHDCAILLSGSEDSGVNVWSLSRLLDDNLQNDLQTPYCTLSDHTLPVTDIICGVGPFPTCRVLTASVDHSVKLWDLSSRSLLTTFQFPKPIVSLAWDLTERMFFAASNDGSIHQMNLFRQRDDGSGVQTMEAVGGAGVSDIIRVDESKRRLISVGQPITSLTISLTSSLLVVGTSAGLIHIYDIHSYQLLRTISVHHGLSVTFLMTMLKPPDLIGHVSLNLSIGASATEARELISVKPIIPFQRMRDVKSREAHEVSMLLTGQHDAFDDDEYSAEELIRDHSFFVQSSSPPSGASTAVSLQSKVLELEAEVGWLKEQLGKAKSVNDVMWENVVQRVMNRRGKETVGEADEMDVEDDQMRRKRSRN